MDILILKTSYFIIRSISLLNLRENRIDKCMTTGTPSSMGDIDCVTFVQRCVSVVI